MRMMRYGFEWVLSDNRSVVARCLACCGVSFLASVGAGGFVGRIGDALAADAREWREFVKIGARGSHDVFHGVAADGEHVGDERAMAAPGNGFGAHDGAGLCPGKAFEAGERGGEFGSLHVVGETAKTGIVPAGVDGIGARVAQAAQFWEVGVGDVRAAKGLGEGVMIELRIVAGLRNGAHVDETFDVVRFQEREEVVDGTVGMANGEEERLRGDTLGRTHASII